MEFTIMFVIIFIISSSLSMILNKKIEQMIPITVMGITLLVYSFGIFECLQIGVKSILVILIISICCLIKEIYFSIKNKQLKNKLKNIFTPGLAVYTIIYIGFIIINKRSIFTHHDEFTHWGLIIKNMFIYNSFGTIDASIVQYNEYPPFTAVFQYIFLAFKGNYSETTIITASNILYLSIMISILRNVDWKNNLRKLLIYVSIILFLPMVFYIDFYKIILVDGLLGVFFAYVLYNWYIEDKESNIRNVTVALGLASLALMKLSGMGLSIIAVLIILGDVLITNKKEDLKKEILNIVKIVIVLLVFILSWRVKMFVTDANTNWDLNNININSIIHVFDDNENVGIVKGYINTFFRISMISEKNISAFSVILIIIAASIYIHKKLDNNERKRYTYYTITLLITTFLYFLMTLVTYLFILPKREAVQIPCFERYNATILLSMVIFHVIVFLERKNYFSNKALCASICLMIAIFPTVSIIDGAAELERSKLKEITTRVLHAKIINYQDEMNENDKIYFMTKSNTNMLVELKISKYLMMPIKIGNSNMSLTNDDNFMEKLQEENYTHIYVYRTDEEFIQRHQKFFGNTEIKNMTMYEITEAGEVIEMIKNL